MKNTNILNAVGVAGRIKDLVQKLNGELKAAHELQLKVYIGTRGLLAVRGPEEVTVRIWREEEFLWEPKQNADEADLDAERRQREVGTTA